ncbi:hypothetical protein CC80DRAFT_405550, partial [Byssothecium circinans]
RRKLTPQQELELVSYIEKLTAHHLPPTREMLQNFTLSITQTNGEQLVGKSWVTQFINHYNVEITPH